MLRAGIGIHDSFLPGLLGNHVQDTTHHSRLQNISRDWYAGLLFQLIVRRVLNDQHLPPVSRRIIGEQYYRRFTGVQIQLFAAEGNAQTRQSFRIAGI